MLLFNVNVFTARDNYARANNARANNARANNARATPNVSFRLFRNVKTLFGG
jgi:hypothetical protein